MKVTNWLIVSALLILRAIPGEGSDPFNSDECPQLIALWGEYYLKEITRSSGTYDHFAEAQKRELSLRRARHRLAEERYSLLWNQTEWLGSHYDEIRDVFEAAYYPLVQHLRAGTAANDIDALPIGMDKAWQTAQLRSATAIRERVERLFMDEQDWLVENLKPTLTARPGLTLAAYENFWAASRTETNLARYMLLFYETHEFFASRSFNRPFVNPEEEIRLSVVWAVKHLNAGHGDTQAHITEHDLAYLLPIYTGPDWSPMMCPIPCHPRRDRDYYRELSSQVIRNPELPLRSRRFISIYNAFVREFRLAEHTSFRELLTFLEKSLSPIPE